jgi:tellurite resistance protein TerC
VLLAFIGVKLVMHALHENNLPFINGGQPLEGVPDIPILVSLGAIVLILGVTTVASLWKSSRDARLEAAGAVALERSDDGTSDSAPSRAATHDVP